MSEKLLPCPFCGMPAHDIGMTEGCDYFISCQGCGVIAIEDTKLGTIKAWNTRSPPKHETPEQYKQRTGKDYPDDGIVWFIAPLMPKWDYMEYRIAKEIEDVIMVIANEHGKPPADWNPNE